MPEPGQTQAPTRDRILKSARKLFNRRGFAEVTIDEIMAEAGLTHGGFYHHFDNKETLYAEAITQFCRNETPESWQRFDPSLRGVELVRSIVGAYLSAEHLRDQDGSCPMVGLPSDTARSGRAAKAAFQQVVEMMVGAFEAHLAPAAEPAKERALALAALCVGGMVLARAVDDALFAEELRQAACHHAERILAQPSARD